MKPPIVLLTDFGTQDPFVGIMKGVMQEISPGTPMIDLTHEIPLGDISRAALTLWSSYRYFPSGSIFLTVVDPGVGTQRLPVIIKTGDYTFIGPDNGVFTYVSGEDFQAWELANPGFALPYPRMTFHGRDIFSPAAAYAVSGVQGWEFGDPVDRLVTLPYPQLQVISQNSIDGEALYSDRFGNVLTSLGVFSQANGSTYRLVPWTGENIPFTFDLEKAHIHIPGGDPLPWAPTFGAIPEGSCAAILGSTGLLEIAANRQSAAKLLNLKPGDSVTLDLTI